jgi:hypothetical protein
MSDLGRQLGEKEIMGVTPASAHSFTPASAAAEIKSLDMDDAFQKAYTSNDGSPENVAARAKMTDLFRAAYPE